MKALHCIPRSPFRRVLPTILWTVLIPGCEGGNDGGPPGPPRRTPDRAADADDADHAPPPAAPQERRAESARLLEEGRKLVERGEKKRAAEKLRRAFQLDRENTGAGMQLAELLIDSERFEEALETLDGLRGALEAASGGPALPGGAGAPKGDTRALAKALFLEGRAFKALGDNAEAEKALRRSVELGPTNAASRAVLGNVLALAGKHEESVQHLEEALRGMETVGFLHGREQIHYQLAQSLTALGRKAEADKHRQAQTALQERLAALSRLELAAQNRPDSAQAHRDLGRARYSLGFLEDAATSYADAARLDPRDARTLAALAVCRLKQEKAAEARPLIERSLAQEATASGYYALALSRWYAQEGRAAQEALARAMTLLHDSDGPLRDEIRSLDAQLRRLREN